MVEQTERLKVHEDKISLLGIESPIQAANQKRTKFSPTTTKKILKTSEINFHHFF